MTESLIAGLSVHLDVPARETGELVVVVRRTDQEGTPAGGGLAMVMDGYVELNSGNSVDLANGAELALAGDTDIDRGNAGALDAISEVVVVIDHVTRERPVRVMPQKTLKTAFPPAFPRTQPPPLAKPYAIAIAFGAKAVPPLRQSPSGHGFALCVSPHFSKPSRSAAGAALSAPQSGWQ